MGLSTAPSGPGHKWQMGKDGVAAMGYRVLSRVAVLPLARLPAPTRVTPRRLASRSAADSILTESVMDRPRSESGASLDNRGSGGRATCHRYRLVASEGSGICDGRKAMVHWRRQTTRVTCCDSYAVDHGVSARPPRIAAVQMAGRRPAATVKEWPAVHRKGTRLFTPGPLHRTEVTIPPLTSPQPWPDQKSSCTSRC
jgi:hypothetical protein